MLSLHKGTVGGLAQQADHSLLRQLQVDPEHDLYAPNKRSRQVRSGHYVPVLPTPLPSPYLVAFSKPMAETLGLSEEECRGERFVRFFSGDMSVVDGFKSWATPYALSIYGQEMYQNCPFGNGNGYGDGRAISVGEVLVNGKRWELQLKGGGTTPFCRGADGRAVLRSSVREFLASEAVHNLGISTTRALSLVASGTETVDRPWFSCKPKKLPNINDPRLQNYPPPLRNLILDQLQSALREPDIVQSSICAITCRVSPSFLRVGQIELFGRRVYNTPATNPTKVQQSRKELQQIVEHLLFREFPHIHQSNDPLHTKILSMLEESSKNIALLTANWIRVGFTQGNFNSDNCLVAGRTMDYGPFGFVEKFERYWNMWTGGGRHFGFLNQPVAGGKNFGSLVNAVSPLLEGEAYEQAQDILRNYTEVATNTVNEMWSKKLGLGEWSLQVSELLQDLLDLMEGSQADYTLLWRQLSVIAERYVGDPPEAVEDVQLLEPLKDCFYQVLSPESVTKWCNWTRRWLAALNQLATPGPDIALQMKKVSPKFIPREWMLVNAYTAAIKGDHSPIEELQQLFLNPYDELTDRETLKFYKKAPEEVYLAGGAGGTAFMT